MNTNTATAVSPQAVSRILNAAGIKKAHSYRSGIKRQGRRTLEGYKVVAFRDTVEVSYWQSTNSWVTWADFKPTHEAAITKITEVLTAKGFVVTASTHSKDLLVTKADA
jgi:hypothetical protein